MKLNEIEAKKDKREKKEYREPYSGNDFGITLLNFGNEKGHVISDNGKEIRVSKDLQPGAIIPAYDDYDKEQDAR